MVFRSDPPDLEMDMYGDDEHSRDTTLSGPSRHDVEAIHNRSLSKKIMENKLFFGLGAFAICLASIPILLFGLNNFSISGQTKSTIGIALVNDMCASAVMLENGGAPLLATTAGANRDDDGDVATCGVSLGVGPSVWFKVVGTGGPVKVFKQDEQSFTNQLSVYQGHCGELTCLTGDNLKGSVFWNTEVGEIYFIRVSGVNGVTGNFQIVMQDLSGVNGDAPLNDICEDSIGLAVDGSFYPATTEGATFDIDGAGSCYRTANAGSGVWYSVIGSGGSLIATTNSSSALLAVFSGACDNLECVSASDLEGDVAPLVQWNSRSGEHYYILAHGVGSQEGSPFEISVSDSKADDQNFVINDYCKGAIGPLATDGSVVRGSTEFATYDSDGAGTCYPTILSGDGVWYHTLGTGGMLLVYPTLGSHVEPLVSVFKGDCRKLDCVEGTHYNIDEEERKVLSWLSEDSETYYILVRGVGNAKGPFELSIESRAAEPTTTIPTPMPTPKPTSKPTTNWATGGETIEIAQLDPPANDYCDSAQHIATMNSITPGTTQGATFYMDDIGICHSHDDAGSGVWYRVIGTGEKIRLSTTESSEISTMFSVYVGDCEELFCVGDASSNTAPQQTFEWVSKENTAYYVLVQGQIGRAGTFEIKVDELVEKNDECINAQGPLPTNGTFVFGSNQYATVDTVGPGDCFETEQTGLGVWYTVMGTGQPIEIFAEGMSGSPLIVSILSGSDCSSLSCLASSYVSTGERGQVTFDSMQDVTYYLLVHGIDSASVGLFSLVLESANKEADNIGEGAVEIDVIMDNDTCEGASGPLTATNAVVAASTEGAMEVEVLFRQGACSGAGSYGRWYTVDGEDAVITASVATFSNATVTGLAVYSGICTALKCETGIDSSVGNRKSVSWSSTNGSTYYIYVHTTAESSGSFELSLEHSQPQSTDAPTDVPSTDSPTTNVPDVVVENDDCVNAQGPLPTNGTVFFGSDQFATPDSIAPGYCFNNEQTGLGVWYTIIGTGNKIEVTAEGLAGLPILVSVLGGPGCDSLSCLVSSMMPTGQRGFVGFNSTLDVKYYILVHGLKATVGPFKISAFDLGNQAKDESLPTSSPTSAPTPPPTPGNDLCASALEVTSGTMYEGSTSGATIDTTITNNCKGYSNLGPGVWHKLVGNGNIWTLTHSETYTDEVTVSVYSGSCEALQCLSSYSSAVEYLAPITWGTIAGKSYYILVESNAGTDATFGFTLEQQAPAPPTEAPQLPIVGTDLCTDATGSLEAGSQISGTFSQATPDSMQCGTAPNDRAGVWFTVTGTGGGLRFSTCSGFTAEQPTPGADTSYASVSVYRQGCDNLQCHIGSNNTCTDSGLVEWNSEEGELYHILVSGDAAAMASGYKLMHDHIHWQARNCRARGEGFVEQLHILKQLFEGTGNTLESGPLLGKGWMKGCDICSKWKGLQCNSNEEITRINLGE
jgi:hypothetical protein